MAATVWIPENVRLEYYQPEYELVASQIVGSGNPWDAGDDSYTHNVATWNWSGPGEFTGHYSYSHAVGDVPADVLAALAEPDSLTSITAHVRVKTHEELAGAEDNNFIFFIGPSDFSGTPVQVNYPGATGIALDSFRLPSDDTIYTVDSQTISLPNVFDLASMEDIRLALLQGTVWVGVPLQVVGFTDNTNEVWVYELWFDMEAVDAALPTGVAELETRRHFEPVRRG